MFPEMFAVKRATVGSFVPDDWDRRVFLFNVRLAVVHIKGFNVLCF